MPYKRLPLLGLDIFYPPKSPNFWNIELFFNSYCYVNRRSSQSDTRTRADDYCWAPRCDVRHEASILKVPLKGLLGTFHIDLSDRVSCHRPSYVREIAPSLGWAILIAAVVARL